LPGVGNDAIAAPNRDATKDSPNNNGYDFDGCRGLIV
jgi:hypothetical protein